jgi:hypothetical protein
MTDFMSALRQYLLGQQTVTDLCGTSIYVFSLPEEELKLGAHYAVVLLSLGGDMNMRRAISEARVDIACYGATDFLAASLERCVAEAMKQIQRTVCANVLLHNASLAAGPFQTRDPDTFWPCMRRQALLRADEREVGSATV